MSGRAIADTGLLVAYLNRRDAHHGWAVEQFSRFVSFLTCEGVITEASHLAGRPGPVLELMTRGVLQLAYTLDSDERAVATLLAKYEDRPMDYADACLVRMSETHPTLEVLTIDSDFRFYQRHGSDPIPVVMPQA